MRSGYNRNSEDVEIRRDVFEEQQQSNVQNYQSEQENFENIRNEFQ